MHQLSLAAALLDLANATEQKPAKWSLRSSMTTAFFVEKGHVMETIKHEKTGRHIVTLFFGPGEFAVLCHPHSNMAALDNISGNPFEHGMIFRTLRKFPESHLHYREVQRKYQEKVAARIKSLTTMSPEQRYADLVASQPWVIRLAQPADIASYLDISVQLLQELKNNSHRK